MSSVDLEQYISPTLMREIEMEIDANESYQKLKERHKECLNRHDYIGALRIAKMLEEAKKNVVQAIVNNQVVKQELVNDLMKSMSDEDQTRLSVSLNIILFSIDQIDYHITESNEIIKKYHPDCTLEMYDKLNELGREAKELVNYLGDNERMELQIIFSDIADNLTELLVNKVKSYIRKKKKKGVIV